MNALRRDAIILLAICATSLFAASCNTESDVPSPRKISFGAVRAAYYLPFFVIKERRLLEKRGYITKLEIYERNTDMLNDFTSGRIDVTAQSSLTMFPLEARAPNRFKFIYGQYNHSYSFLVPPKSPLQSLAQLRGKTIATWTSPTAYLSVSLVLEPLIGDIDSITINRVEISMLNQVLADGSVDAVFSTDVYIAQALRQNWGRYLAAREPLPEYVVRPFFSGGGFVSPDLIASESKVVAAVQEACEEAIEFITTNEQEARALMVPYLKTVATEDALRAPLDEYVPARRTDLQMAQRLSDLLHEKSKMERRVDVRNLFYFRE